MVHGRCRLPSTEFDEHRQTRFASMSLFSTHQEAPSSSSTRWTVLRCTLDVFGRVNMRHVHMSFISLGTPSIVAAEHLQHGPQSTRVPNVPKSQHAASCKVRAVSRSRPGSSLW